MTAGNEKPQKISIGFLGGQVLSARVDPQELTRLRQALGDRRAGTTSPPRTARSRST